VIGTIRLGNKLGNLRNIHGETQLTHSRSLDLFFTAQVSFLRVGGGL